MSGNSITAEQATISVLAEDAAATIAALLTKGAEQRVRIMQLEQAVNQLRADLRAATAEQSPEPDGDPAEAQGDDQPPSAGEGFDDPEA